MLEELILRFSQTDFEDYGTLFLKSAEWIDELEKLNLQLQVKIDEEPNFPANWEIVCTGVRTHQLNLGYVYDFVLDTDHVLSWEYVKPCCSVSFNGKTNNIFAVIGSLYKTHIKIAEDWIPFNRYFNEMMKLDELIAGGFGQLIETAPENFSKEYENVMKEYGFSTSRSESRPPSYWNGEQWISKTVSLSTMIFDNSHIVAETFEAKYI